MSAWRAAVKEPRSWQVRWKLPNRLFFGFQVVAIGMNVGCGRIQPRKNARNLDVAGATRAITAASVASGVPAMVPLPSGQSTSATPLSDRDTGQQSDISTVAPTLHRAEVPARDYLDDVRRLPVREQQAALLRAFTEAGDLDPPALARVKSLLEGSEWMSFGNPKTSHPPMTRQECRARRSSAKVHPADPRCGAPNMVPVYDPTRGESVADARVCIDQYEFPNLACEYPLVWVRASEAANLCSAVGKRLCDAHEWEGACAGALLPVEAEYPWAQMPKGVTNGSRKDKRLWLEYEHNRTRDVLWAYGSEQDLPLCATGAVKNPKCDVVDWGTCGSNTYPAGAFPQCVSKLGVYDQHGNAAEHMNLPLQPSELMSRGGIGWTEMKGSWFLFQTQQAHPDDCRWRAKAWHTTRVSSFNSHRNYHLGFRCCRSLPP